MSGWGRYLAASLVVLVALSFARPGAARAHEGRMVANNYLLSAGFLSEPALTGEMNGFVLEVTVPAESGRPVLGLEQSLKVTVMFAEGARAMPLDLAPRLGQPGAYDARFVPTREGSYLFLLAGTIEGTPVNEKFESKAGHLGDVKSVQALHFPDRVPDAVTMSRAILAAQSEAAAARMLAAAGLAVGLAAVALHGVSLLSRRRTAKSESRPGAVVAERRSA